MSLDVKGQSEVVLSKSLLCYLYGNVAKGLVLILLAVNDLFNNSHINFITKITPPLVFSYVKISKISKLYTHKHTNQITK